MNKAFGLPLHFNKSSLSIKYNPSTLFTSSLYNPLLSAGKQQQPVLNRDVVHNLNKTKYSLIFLHGLFGSSENWRLSNKLLLDKFNKHQQLDNSSIGNAYQHNDNNTLDIDLYSLDLRNHGGSPHSNEMTFDNINDDLSLFIHSNIYNQSNSSSDIDHKIVLVGHSMGGKSSMLYSLFNPTYVDGLVCVDVAPSNYVGIHNHDSKFLSMFEASKYFAQHDIDKKKIEDIMESFNLDKGERLYLLNNLVENNNNNSLDKYSWKLNVQTLYEYQNDMLSFPNDIVNRVEPFHKKVLFIGGGDSHYLLPKYRGNIQYLFPNNEIHFIAGTGHFAHAQKPKTFVEYLYRYLFDLITNNNNHIGIQNSNNNHINLTNIDLSLMNNNNNNNNKQI
ncbi:hypothetical protein CYY_000750 [Polysphondylium violaceum]|uniref:AB hydrolase-1 domain-containing protein n=1 Tax=Polysphondylium violaceum TaxID=133409 RepID=A0A8J4Q3B1_9MYCE|nr:hypothetical protein CYY_000750 [Polysphondylium violaceum]